MIVSLLTDFQDTGYYVAAMKAVILSECPEAVMIDVTHKVPPQDIRFAAFVLEQFAGTVKGPAVHLVVVDPGVGTSRRAIAVRRKDGQFFVGPDNGVMWWALRGQVEAVKELPVPEGASLTFHGRDVFAPNAARIACDPGYFESLKAVEGMKSLPYPTFEVRGSRIMSDVLFIDPFGNVILPIPKNREIIERGSRLFVSAGSFSGEVPFGTYEDVQRGGIVWHFDSSGYVEIAMREGSFAQFAGISGKDKVVVERRA